MTRLPPKDKPTDAEVEAVYDRLPTHCYGPNKGQGFYSMSTIRAVLTAYFAARTPITSSAGGLEDRIAAAMQKAREDIGATEQQRVAFAYAEAAMRSVMATAKLNSEALVEALNDARFAIGALEAQLVGFAQPVVNVAFIQDKIDAALAERGERP